MATIRQLAKLLEITPQTIRNYEKDGLVKTTRDSSNYRTYDEGKKTVAYIHQQLPKATAILLFVM